MKFSHFIGISCIAAAAAGIGFIAGSYYYYYIPFYQSVTKAVAVVAPTKGNTAHGVVTFTQQFDGVHITARVSGLTPGAHGFHIHEFGNCACDDAKCTGDHFNPSKKLHGAPDSSTSHVGDLGNITADEKGYGTYTAINPYFQLYGPHSIIGRAVIIHESEDDLKTQPTGNSGARIGAGVIGIAKEG